MDSFTFPKSTENSSFHGKSFAPKGKNDIAHMQSGGFSEIFVPSSDNFIDEITEEDTESLLDEINDQYSSNSFQMSPNLKPTTSHHQNLPSRFSHIVSKTFADPSTPTSLTSPITTTHISDLKSSEWHRLHNFELNMQESHGNTNTQSFPSSPTSLRSSRNISSPGSFSVNFSPRSKQSQSRPLSISSGSIFDPPYPMSPKFERQNNEGNYTFNPINRVSRVSICGNRLGHRRSDTYGLYLFEDVDVADSSLDFNEGNDLNHEITFSLPQGSESESDDSCGELLEINQAVCGIGKHGSDLEFTGHKVSPTKAGKNELVNSNSKKNVVYVIDKPTDLCLDLDEIKNVF